MKKVDATQGSMLKAIFTFAIPMILATIAQALFTVAVFCICTTNTSPPRQLCFLSLFT